MAIQDPTGIVLRVRGDCGQRGVDRWRALLSDIVVSTALANANCAACGWRVLDDSSRHHGQGCVRQRVLACGSAVFPCVSQPDIGVIPVSGVQKRK